MQSRYRIQSTEYRIPNREYGVPTVPYSTLLYSALLDFDLFYSLIDRRIQNTEYRALSMENRVQSTECRVGMEYKLQNIEHRI